MTLHPRKGQAKQRSNTEKYRLHSWLRSRSVRGGARSCMLPAATAAEIRVSRTAAGVVHVDGVTRCASVSSCPVCGPTIRHGRAVEIDAAIDEAKARGWVVLFVTATVSHKLGTNLADVLGLVQGAWSRTFSGRAFADWKLRHAYIGSLRTVEVTYGANGWHPHIHAVLFFKPGDRGGGVWNLGQTFGRHVQQMGGLSQAVNSGDGSCVGWDVVEVEDVGAVSEYMAGVGKDHAEPWSVGCEMAKTHLKVARRGGLKPFDLLRRAVDGCEDSAALWRIYETVMQGRRVFVWSKGLKAELGQVEVEDSELLDVPPDAVIVAEWLIPRERWLFWALNGLLGVKLDWFDTEPIPIAA